MQNPVRSFLPSPPSKRTHFVISPRMKIHYATRISRGTSRVIVEGSEKLVSRFYWCILYHAMLQCDKTRRASCELHTEKSSTILITPILHRKVIARLQLSTWGLYDSRSPAQDATKVEEGWLVHSVKGIWRTFLRKRETLRTKLRERSHLIVANRACNQRSL